MIDLRNGRIEYGVNFPEVMERFVDHEALYVDCLTAFLHDPAFDGLKESLSSKEYEAAFDHAHTLKGVAGNLGLVPLYHALCDIVEPLRNHDYLNIAKQYDTVNQEKKKLQQMIIVWEG